MIVSRFFVSVFVILLSLSCKHQVPNTTIADSNVDDVDASATFLYTIDYEYVLAQWTFNKALFAGEMSTHDFIRTAADLEFVGVEYVNQFFIDRVEDIEYLESLKKTTEETGIEGTLLMIDLAGNLGASHDVERKNAIAEHKKWIVAASIMGCPTVRVNAHGDGDRQEMMDACFKSIRDLAQYGKKHNVRVIVENHGQYSSDGKWLSELIGKLMPYQVGSLADFDNWCIEREGGKLWGAPCINEYDRYKGVRELLPTAQSVSLKAFSFDDEGGAEKTDFSKMCDLIIDAQYDGYLAVEFEGDQIDPIEGIRKTLSLTKKYLEP